MDEPLVAHSANEVRYYLMVRPCPRCGKGPLTAEEGPAADGDPRREIPRSGSPAAAGRIRVRARCHSCAAVHEMAFACDAPAADLLDEASESETINAGSAPSKLIDLGQWVSLFYLLVESAASEPSPPAARQLGHRAALCLAEALKFYSDNELPPQTAFFTRASQDAFREHPENFARQRLRDMQDRLPAPSSAARVAAGGDRPGRRRWWRFWSR
ncbi:MAG: hypothetical protein ACE15C_17045 [Phycisphaerae bacterium]